MKKIILFFSLLSIISCSSDDSAQPVDPNNNGNATPETMLKTDLWKTVSYTTNGQTYEFVDCYNTTGDAAHYMFRTYNFNNEFVDDDTYVSFSNCDYNWESTGAYTFENNVITLDFNGDVWTGNVTFLTNTRIKIDFTSATQGNVTGTSLTLEQTNTEGIEAGMPAEITGTWNLTGKMFNGNNVSLSNCEMQSTLTFQATSFFTGANYSNETGSCTSEQIGGQWYSQNALNFMLSTNAFDGSNMVRLLSANTLRISIIDSWTEDVTDYIYTRG